MSATYIRARDPASSLTTGWLQAERFLDLRGDETNIVEDQREAIFIIEN